MKKEVKASRSHEERLAAVFVYNFSMTSGQIILQKSRSVKSFKSALARDVTPNRDHLTNDYFNSNM